MTINEEAYRSKLKQESYYLRKDAWNFFYPEKSDRHRGGFWVLAILEQALRKDTFVIFPLI
jgi:hypothetical protein